MFTPLLFVILLSQFAGVEDVPYEHFFHTPYPIAGLPSLSDTISIPLVVMNGDKTVTYVGTNEGLFAFSTENQEWIEVVCLSEKGPVFDIEKGPEGKLYIGAWDGLYELVDGKSNKIEEVGSGPIAVVKCFDKSIIAGGYNGIYTYSTDKGWEQKKGTLPKSIRDIAIDSSSQIWVATEVGLVRIKDNDKKYYKHNEDLFSSENEEERLVSNSLMTVCVLPEDEIWVGGLGGITVLKNGKVIKHYRYNEFPGEQIKKIVYDSNLDKVWVGTNNGLIYMSRERNTSKKVFRSRRWLLNDNIFDIDLSPNNIYVSTQGGISQLKIEYKTLKEKAEYFEELAQIRHTREPGLVEKCLLRVPGDVSTWGPLDDDNDGGYTNMYLAALSLQYAVTKDENVRQRAKQIFQAILFLEQVTEMPGFIARTVVPHTWTRVLDPNEDLTPQGIAFLKTQDPRYKPVPERWRKSKDGKWLWKGDTSSDEITAHFFGWSIYYDIAADEADKKELEQLVSRVMDKIITDGYVLKDIDGTHTRWGVWAPERLKHDPDWANERGINALEILSYLKASYHITGDSKYQQEYERLLIDEDYASLVKKAKNYGPSSRTHIDDELLAFTYPALFRYETDEKWLELYRESIQHWHRGIENEHSPLYDFIYAWCMGSNQNLNETITTLREIPFDLINWTVDNSNREDIHLVREPILEHIQTSRLLPPGETGVIRWDKNRWQAVQGDGGTTEWASTFYLFPYWLGRYLGLIE
ncbi:MAG TPA: hypothetical protein PLX23_00505 [Candidatus Hydrogenedens sp.]|nr:hypothetical protein [Candidatus Hydrogenedens sp.]